jgi:hypothetical protein
MSSDDLQTSRETRQRLAQVGSLALAVFSVIGLGLFFLRRIDAARTQLQQVREEAGQASRRLRALERRAGLRRTPVFAATASAMPAPREAFPSAAGFDYAAAIERSEHDVVEIIAALFVETAPGQVQRLGAWLAAGDAGEAWRLAQALRGTLEAFNADPALELIGEIERCCQQGAMTDCRQLVFLLEREVSALCGSLKRSGF